MLKKRFSSITVSAKILAIVCCLSAVTWAQPQAPEPPAGNFTETLVNLINRSAQLLEVLKQQIESPMMPYFEMISGSIALLMIIVGFSHMWRENGGAGVDLYWWFGRVVVCMMLFTNGPRIIDNMAAIGYNIANGYGNSPVVDFYTTQQINFDDAYQRFVEKNFTVKGAPQDPETGNIMGVILNTGQNTPDVEKKFNELSQNMPLWFNTLSIARGILTFGDLFLTMMAYFVYIALRLAVPFMIALALDRSMAAKVSYPFLWGTAVLTLIWPTVRLLICGIAYAGGNLAMALGNTKDIYTFEQDTLQVIQDPNFHPIYTVMIATTIMTIVGLCLWASPYLAYSLSTGKVYESVSQTVSHWAGAITGSAIEGYTSMNAAAITRHAENTQAQGQYFSETTRASSEKDAGDIGARANKIRGLTQIASSEYAATEGAKADYDYGQRMTGSEVARAQALRQNTYDGQMKEYNLDADMQNRGIAAEFSQSQWGADITSKLPQWTTDLMGIPQGPPSNSPIVDNILPEMGKSGAAAIQALGSHVAVPGGSGISDYIGRRYANPIRSENIEYGNIERTKIASGIYRKDQDVQGQYGKDVVKNQEVYRDARINVAQGSASIARGGVNTGYKLDLQSNATRYAGTIKAAGITRDSSIEAARLRSVASVINSLGHNLAKNAEEGLKLRY